MTIRPGPDPTSRRTASATPPTETDPWGAHASTYDAVYAPLTGYVARSLFALTEARLPPSARVLDIACGSGALLVPAVERAARRRRAGDGDFVVGCDYSAGMLAIADDKAGAIADDAYRCEVHDGQALGFDDASFDAAFSCFGIFLFEDRAAGWREAARVLRPGGIFATTTWRAPADNEMFREQFGAVMAALPARLTEGRAPPGWLAVADPEGLVSEVEAAGLRDAQVHPFRTAFVIPSLEVAWGAMLENPASQGVLQQCTEDELRVARAAYMASMAARAGGADRPVVLEAACNLLVARRR